MNYRTGSSKASLADIEAAIMAKPPRRKVKKSSHQKQAGEVRHYDVTIKTPEGSILLETSATKRGDALSEARQWYRLECSQFPASAKFRAHLRTD